MVARVRGQVQSDLKEFGGSDGIFLFLDCDSGYTTVDIYQNSE